MTEPCPHIHLKRIILPMLTLTYRCEDCDAKLLAELKPLDMRVKVLEGK